MTIIFKRSGQYEIELRLDSYVVLLIAGINIVRSVLASLGILP